VSIDVITTSVSTKPATVTLPEPEPAVSADIVIIPEAMIDGPRDMIPVASGNVITESGVPGVTAPYEPTLVASELVEPCVNV
jgi:hypothetical protein